MGECLEKKQQEAITCEITISMEDYCKRVMEENKPGSPAYDVCREELLRLSMMKFGSLDKRLQDDTLTLVVSPQFKVDWHDVLDVKK